MNTPRPDLALIGLVALVVIAAGVLAGIHVDVPGWFRDVAFVALGGGAGVAHQNRGAARATDPPVQVLVPSGS